MTGKIGRDLLFILVQKMEHNNFEELIRNSNLLENNFKSFSSKVEKRSKIWEHYEKNSHPQKIQKLVMLNVGGNKFTTQISTLTTEQETYFTKEVLNLDLSKEVFIDRPGKNFNYILNYLRTKAMPNIIDMSATQKSEIIMEAEFYGVT